jgi:hypothetical protein
MNSEKGATSATSATHWVKLLICNTIVCSRYEVSTCYTFFVPATHYKKPLKATHLSSVRKSNAQPNMISGVSIVNRVLRTRDLRRLVLKCFMGFLR